MYIIFTSVCKYCNCFSQTFVVGFIKNYLKSSLKFGDKFIILRRFKAKKIIGI